MTRHLIRCAASITVPLACAALVACGGGNSPQTPNASPTLPRPTASPASAGHLHVLQHLYGWDHPGQLLSYEIDGTTGRLRSPVSQNLGDAQVLASDPRGRFVYAAHGGWARGWAGAPDPDSDLAVAAYAPDATDGSLHDVSTAVVAQRPQSADSSVWWEWLRAGSARLHGVVGTAWGWGEFHWQYTYVSIPVDGDGRLGTAVSHDFVEDADVGMVIVDPRADMLYKAGTMPLTPDTQEKLGGLTAHAIFADGTVHATGWTNLCLGTAMPPGDSAIPLVAVRDFLFASVPRLSQPPDYSYSSRVCSYRGQRLKTWDDLGFTAWRGTAFVPSAKTDPALVAMFVSGQTASELRLFALNDNGDLQTLSIEELPESAAQILFHPFGRFLYVSDVGRSGTLRTYAIGADRRLTLLERLDGGGGSWDSHYHWNAESMAVSLGQER